MPLDGHDFLVSQGWTGKGTGLRQGAITRPLAIPQKKNLAGLGKDRDEAFPFWDHLFSAAAKSIQLKISDSDESDDEDTPLPEIKRTVTGIMSNRRPITGVAASASTSGTNTPDVTDNCSRLNLLAVAKRDAARSSLYARFFRGPVLGPDDDLSLPTTSSTDCRAPAAEDPPIVDDKTKGDGDEDIANKSKKRKRDVDDETARLQQKKERKEQKVKEREERKARRREKRESKEADGQGTDDSHEKEKALEKEERRARRRERRDAREADLHQTTGKEMGREKRERVLEEKDEDLTPTVRGEEEGKKKKKKKTVDAQTIELRSENESFSDAQSVTPKHTTTDKDVLDHERKKKKKRKRE